MDKYEFSIGLSFFFVFPTYMHVQLPAFVMQFVIVLWNKMNQGIMEILLLEFLKNPPLGIDTI